MRTILTCLVAVGAMLTLSSCYYHDGYYGGGGYGHAPSYSSYGGYRPPSYRSSYSRGYGYSGYRGGYGGYRGGGYCY